MYKEIITKNCKSTNNQKKYSQALSKKQLDKFHKTSILKKQ